MGLKSHAAHARRSNRSRACFIVPTPHSRRPCQNPVYEPTHRQRYTANARAYPRPWTIGRAGVHTRSLIFLGAPSLEGVALEALRLFIASRLRSCNVGRPAVNALQAIRRISGASDNIPDLIDNQQPVLPLQRAVNAAEKLRG